MDASRTLQSHRKTCRRLVVYLGMYIHMYSNGYLIIYLPTIDSDVTRALLDYKVPRSRPMPCEQQSMRIPHVAATTEASK